MSMTEFSIVNKPSHITWDQVAACQQRAHTSISHNVNMKCATMSGEELQAAVGNGVCYVALTENNEVIGTLSYKICTVNRWWHKGTAAYICFVAVDPVYQGCGIYSALAAKVEEALHSMAIGVLYLHTHEHNKRAQRAYEKDGYRKVQFTPNSGSDVDYYSIEMAKWIAGRKSYINWIRPAVFFVSKVVVKLLYKPGKIRRF